MAQIVETDIQNGKAKTKHHRKQEMADKSCHDCQQNVTEL